MIEMLKILFLIVGICWFTLDMVNKLIIHKAYKKFVNYCASMINDIVKLIDAIDDVAYAMMDDKQKSDINQFIIDFKKLFNNK